MSTVGKAIALLKAFSVDEPELGLTDLSRRAGYDKATVRRLLMVMSDHGFIEQDSETRLYRLGSGLTRLARIREVRLPLLKTALPFLRTLSEETGETVHLAEAGNGMLATVHVEHPARANRVNVDVGAFLPLHSTASGMAFLAHAHPSIRKESFARPLDVFTAHTVTDPAALTRLVETTRRQGYSVNAQGYEEGVYSVAAAILGADGFAIGTVAVAAPLERTPEVAVSARGRAVAEAAREISELLNGDSQRAVAKRA